MKQIIAAMAAMVISASSIAGVSLSGKYTGTLNDAGVVKVHKIRKHLQKNLFML